MVKITIYGGPGAGTTSVGKCIAKKLNLQFHSSGKYFREYAKQNNQTLNQLNKEGLKNDKIDKTFDKHLQNFQKTKNNFIFDARLGWYFIKDSIKIKLTCNIEERIKRVAKRENIKEEKAKKDILEREKLEKEKYEKIYKIKNFNDTNFDIILDTTNKTVEQSCKYLIEKIKEINKTHL